MSCLFLPAITSCSGDESEVARPATTFASESTGSTAAPTDAALDDLIEMTGLDDPDRIDLPLRNEPELREWLESDGASLVEVVTITAEIWAGSDGSCRQVATDLDRVGSPTELLGIAAATPDASAREVMISLHRALASVLSECTGDAIDPIVLAEFAWQWSLADSLLEDLEVAR